jgi:hypothetical protein
MYIAFDYKCRKCASKVHASTKDTKEVIVEGDLRSIKEIIWHNCEYCYHRNFFTSNLELKAYGGHKPTSVEHPKASINEDS